MERNSDFEQRLTVGMRALAPEPSWGFVERVTGLVDTTPQRSGALPRWQVGLRDTTPGRATLGILLILGLLASIGAAVVVLSRPPIPPDPRPIPGPASVILRGVELPGPVSGQAATVNSVVRVGSQFVAVGSALGGEGWGGPTDMGMIWASPDGLGWRSVAAMDGANVTGVARGGNTLVAVGSRADGTETAFTTSGVAWISTDGQNWEEVAVGPDRFMSVVHGFGVFAAERCPDGDGIDPPACAIWTSLDGRSWTVQTDPLPGSGRLRSTEEGFMWVGGGNTRGGRGSSVFSPDGVTWEQARSQGSLVNMSPMDVTFAGGFVALGAYDSVDPQITPGVWLLKWDGIDWRLGAYVGSFYDPYPFLLVQGTTGIISVIDEGETPSLARWSNGASAQLTDDAENGPEEAHTYDAIALDGDRYLLVGDQTAISSALFRPYAWISKP